MDDYTRDGALSTVAKSKTGVKFGAPAKIGLSRPRRNRIAIITLI